jgi:alkylation response protein AidB-like acyl-CoA dehydrogenase
MSGWPSPLPSLVCIVSTNSPYAEITASLRDAGLTIPVQYGGRGGTALDYVIVVEELFRSSQSWILAEPPFCTAGPGPSMILLHGGDGATLDFPIQRLHRDAIAAMVAGGPPPVTGS